MNFQSLLYSGGNYFSNEAHNISFCFVFVPPLFLWRMERTLISILQLQVQNCATHRDSVRFNYDKIQSDTSMIPEGCQKP